VRWLKQGGPMPAWIFPSPEATALEERNVRTVFARLLAKADMRQICIHDLRHTYSTLLLQTGAQPEAVPTTNRPSVSRLFLNGEPNRNRTCHPETSS